MAKIKIKAVLQADTIILEGTTESGYPELTFTGGFVIIKESKSIQRMYPAAEIKSITKTIE